MQDDPNDDVPNDKLVGPDPLEDPLKDAERIIEKWEKALEDDPESLFLLNEAQCTKMWQNFRRVYNAFKPSSSYPREYKQKCRNIFIDFYSIVERGDAVMEMCTKPQAEHGGAVKKMCSKEQSWLKAAILYGDNEQMFQELSENLQFCVDCACKLTKSLSFTSVVDLKHVDVALLPSQAKVEFKRDFARLKAKLEHLVKEHAGSDNDEVHLAQYFLDKQTFRSKSHPEIQAQNVSQLCSSSQDPSPSKVTLPEKYFEKNRHYPMRGDNYKAGGEGTVVCTANWLGLKCFKKKFDKDGFDEKNFEKFMTNFHKEVNVLERLNHHNIVRLLCSQSGEPSIIMEFVESDLLRFLIRRKEKQIDLVAAVDMMLQMALAMEYSHDQGVVHRDLKSSNILVSPSRHPYLQRLGYVEVKVTDFGLAKVNMREATIPTYKMMGTPRWMAPEAKNPREGERIDWRLADTYSFAITCAEILTLETPRAGGQRPILRGDCPHYLRELLERCWDENPKSRPYFKDIVWTLKNMKKYLLLGIVPECTPSPYLFTTCLPWLEQNFMLQKFKTKDLSTLTMEWAESVLFRAIVASIERRLELAGSIVDNMNERRRHVIVCPTQCSHLVDECKSGLKQVTLTYHNLDPTMMVDLFRYKDKKLQGLARSLDGLISSLMAAEELVGSCGGPHQWKILALALCEPFRFRRARSRFGYCLWELYWSLYVTRSHLEATHSSSKGPLLLTSLSFKWSNQSCKFVRVVDVSGAGDAEIEHLDADGEEEFVRADEERQFQDRNLLLSSVQNPTLEELPVNHWHVISTYLESVCASIWKVPRTNFVNNSLPPELGALLMRRLESESPELEREPGSYLSQTLAVAFHNLNDEKLDRNLKALFSTYQGDWYDCWGWGVKMLLFKNSWIRRDVDDAYIKRLVRIQHPNIVNFIGYQRESQSELEGEGWLFVFEPMTTTLEKLIRTNMAFYSGSSPFSFPVTLDILLQIVEAMIHMHQLGVVHLHLEPWNILVQPKYTIDRFGTADLDLHLYYNVKLTYLEDAFRVNLNGLVGSDEFFDRYKRLIGRYYAPKLEGRVKFPKFADVESFGMTACLIASGSYPQSLLPFGATFPEGLKTLIRKCCVRDPYARISVEEIRKELWTLRKNFDIDGLQE